jgi:hypothetical protein
VESNAEFGVGEEDAAIAGGECQSLATLRGLEAQVEAYYRRIQEGIKMDVCFKWKAMLNLVLAIDANTLSSMASTFPS